MFRSKKLLEAIRQCPCAICGAEDGTVCASHSNQLRDGKRKGIKASDAATAALCYVCHTMIDQGAKLSKQERFEMWDEAHRKTMIWLIENEILVVK